MRKIFLHGKTIGIIMDKKQHVLRRSSCFSSQSSECQKVLVDLITSKSNNSKWLNFAQYKLSVKSKYGRIGCLQAEDYLSAIKVLILEAVTVTGASTPFPRFTIIINDEPHSMSSKELITYFFLLIKWEISNTSRNEVNTIPLPQWDEDDKGEPASEDDILLCRDNPGSDFIVQFNDPFDENEIYNSKVFVE
jgi:hypothetical protein